MSRLEIKALVILLFVFLVSCGVQEPAKCEKDADCLVSNKVCRSNVCLVQDSCVQDVDCKYKNEVCKASLCALQEPSIPNTTRLCEASCLTSNECNACTEGRNHCIRGICVVEKRAGSFERCGHKVGKACEDKMVCRGAGDKQYCLSECDPKNKRCPDQQSSCLDPYNAGVGACFPDGKAKEGEACSNNFQGDSRIDTSMICVEDLQCVQSKCVKPVVVEDYKQCGNGKTCKEKASCTSLTANTSLGYCLPHCEVSSKECNGGKGNCVELFSGVGGCIPKGMVRENQLCGPSGETLEAKHFCVAEFKCVGFGKEQGICLKEIASCDKASCSSDRVCLPGSLNAVCATACSSSQPCVSPLSCQPIQNASGTPLSICAP